MKCKKQIIKTSLLAFGLSMGVGLTEAPSALAAPIKNEVLSESEELQISKIFKHGNIFGEINSIDWTNQNNVKKLKSALSSKGTLNLLDFGEHGKDIMYVNLKNILREFGIDSDTVEAFGKLSNDKQEELTKEFQNDLRNLLLQQKSLTNSFTDIVFAEPQFKSAPKERLKTYSKNISLIGTQFLIGVVTIPSALLAGGAIDCIISGGTCVFGYTPVTRNLLTKSVKLLDLLEQQKDSWNPNKYKIREIK